MASEITLNSVGAILQHVGNILKRVQEKHPSEEVDHQLELLNAYLSKIGNEEHGFPKLVDYRISDMLTEILRRKTQMSAGGWDEVLTNLQPLFNIDAAKMRVDAERRFASRYLSELNLSLQNVAKGLNLEVQRFARGDYAADRQELPLPEPENNSFRARLKRALQILLNS